MMIRRITFSVPEPIAQRIKKAAGQTPVSAWITRLVEKELEDAELERLWQDFYQEVNPSPSDVRRSRALVERLRKGKHRRSAA